MMTPSVAGEAHVADADGLAVDGGEDDVVEVAGVDDAAHGAEGDFARGLVDAAAGEFEVLILEGVTHVVDGELVGLESVDVDGDLDGAFNATGEGNVADAREP